MISAQREDAPAGQQIQIPVAVFVVKIRSFAAHIAFVEANCPQHVDENRIDVACMQIVLAALLAVEPFEEVGVHFWGWDFRVLVIKPRDVRCKQSVTLPNRRRK